MFILTSVPRKDSILYPDYWYEGMISIVTGLLFRSTCNHIIELFTFTGQKCLQTKSHFTKVFLICSMVFVASYCISYYIWTVYMGYNHPMPFVGMFFLLGEIAIHLVFWFLFPLELRIKIQLQEQCKAYLIWRVWMILQKIPNQILSIVATMDSIRKLKQGKHS